MNPEPRDKPRALKKFNKLRNFLIGGLGGRARKNIIIATINRKHKVSGEKEGLFIKHFLAPKLLQYFKQYPIEIYIEGVNSKGETQLKNRFFGSKPAFDFSFSSPTTLFSTPDFPLGTVGEVKYDKLTFRAFITGLGQVIGYRQAANAEGKHKSYGYYIFFNTELDKTLTENEKNFLKELWGKENIFVLVI